ncbi:MAG: 3-hydroxyacyl-CoA dehydrogenase/enoyl-CoA hydratase family protein [Flavobacteriaceae bacterium]|nr:3-hydroxyacyl-CoA dehydrogenase/enoyl-CoA hydratase family protein [Flavobacteriaceae bacterium]
MSYKVKKAVVLGSGVMGSGIACHLANVGIDVLMLDIQPNDKSIKNKNLIADESLKNAIKSRPNPLYKKEYAKRITTGNFDDDFEKIKNADWIIEVIVENLEIKRKVFEKVEKFKSDHAFVTSNTSSIPISLLCEGRSDNFKSKFCGTHFFNPPRYLRLFEVIPHTDTDPSLTSFLMEFGDLVLGKQTVLCKDTPGFIGNRIGVMSGIKVLQLTGKYNFTIEEVDLMTGTVIGHPSSGSYRLQDIVGLDTSDKVTNFLVDNVKTDTFYSKLKDQPENKSFKFLIDKNFLGNKTGKGYYEKTKEKDENGKTIINALDLETNTYRKSIKPNLPEIKEAKSIELFDRRLKFLVEGDSNPSKFYREYYSCLLSYAAMSVPEIADEYYQVDDALRTGYAWNHGPFELWDNLGLDFAIDMIQKCGDEIPDWISEMKNSGAESFYKFEDGKKKYFDLKSKKYINVPSAESFFLLDAYRKNNQILKNSECTVHDIGDGVMCIEFQTKGNSIGEGIAKGINEAIDIAEKDGWNGIVIGNNDKQFSVGANLMNIGMMAMQQNYDEIEEFLVGFQKILMRMRTCNVPVVAATHGFVMGGGLEVAIHCDAGIYASESYIGLVEAGVGLIPAGGGTKEMAMRASDSFNTGDVKMPSLIDHFKSIAMGSVSTSAHEAFGLHYLNRNRDFICMNRMRNIAMAKDKAISLKTGYIPPSSRQDIEVLGRAGLSTLYSAINEFKLGNYMSDHDVEVSRKIAYIMCGGDLTYSQNVSEEYLLDLERESFMSLLGNQKTLDRIQYMLMNKKPLRN